MEGTSGTCVRFISFLHHVCSRILYAIINTLLRVLQSSKQSETALLLKIALRQSMGRLSARRVKLVQLHHETRKKILILDPLLVTASANYPWTKGCAATARTNPTGSMLHGKNMHHGQHDPFAPALSSTTSTQPRALPSAPNTIFRWCVCDRPAIVTTSTRKQPMLALLPFMVVSRARVQHQLDPQSSSGAYAGEGKKNHEAISFRCSTLFMELEHRPQ